MVRREDDGRVRGWCCVCVKGMLASDAEFVFFLATMARRDKLILVLA
jgi:hypothetical protein